jgi:hypothetical protein
MANKQPARDENPFASPQEASPPMVRPGLSFKAKLTALLASLLAGFLAAVLVFFPIGLAIFGRNSNAGHLWPVPIVVTLAVATGVAFATWKWLTRPARRR